MARSGLTKSQVKASRDRLLAQGRYPSVDAVRQELGNTGSKSTIHKYLKELAEQDGEGGDQREQTARSLHTLVEQLADRLHDDAAQRVHAMTVEHEMALRQKDAELATLRRTVAQLQARIDALESGVDPQPEPGFGNFNQLFASSRGGQRDDTAFNIVLAGGRRMTVERNSSQINLTSLLPLS
jgi:hypothetical protein